MSSVMLMAMASWTSSYWLTLLLGGGWPLSPQEPLPRPSVSSYSPSHPVKAYTFYATPGLYAQLADTVHRPHQFIYPGGHAYVRGTVGRHWLVVSYDSTPQAPLYYLRRAELVEVRPYKQ